MLGMQQFHRTISIKKNLVNLLLEFIKNIRKTWYSNKKKRIEIWIDFNVKNYLSQLSLII